MTWANVDDVFQLTGATVEQDQVSQAQGHIDLYSGVTYANASNLETRDKRLLKMATAYQAAFVASQIDLASRVGVTSMSQDGASVNVRAPDDLILSPLAQRCLGGLSWRRSRTRTLRRRPDGPRTFAAAAAAWLYDENPHGWRSM